jgi:hypothetical protein
MIKLKVQKREITIKTSFNDCTVNDLEAIGERTVENVIKALTDLPHEWIDRIDSETKLFIFGMAEFLDDLEFLNVPNPEKIIDVGECSFENIEIIKQAMNANPQHHNVIPLICRRYMGNEWVDSNNKNVLKVYSQGLQIFDSFRVFMERHKELNELFETQNGDDLTEAGIEALESFGIFGTIYQICDGKPWLFDSLLQAKAEPVYMALRYSKAQSMFQDNLKRIIERKNKAQS